MFLHGQRHPTHVAPNSKGDHKAERAHPRRVVAFRASAHENVHETGEDVHLVAHIGGVGVRRLLVDREAVGTDLGGWHAVEGGLSTVQHPRGVGGGGIGGLMLLLHLGVLLSTS